MQGECVHVCMIVMGVCSYIIPSYFLESLICSHSLRHLNAHDESSENHFFETVLDSIELMILVLTYQHLAMPKHCMIRRKHLIVSFLIEVVILI